MRCCENVCAKCKGIGMLIVGLIVILNTWIGLHWGLVIGLLITLNGLIMIVKPTGCGCCSVQTSTKTTKKKK
ncbi:hypothetical protein J4232_01430 [Candidatus Woesearchaeota archaeon]|nr:hypothetical protein [Candidatus Woesearchaeota archaeon]